MIYPLVVSLCATEGSPGLGWLLPCQHAEDAAEVPLVSRRLGLSQCFSMFPADQELPISR